MRNIIHLLLAALVLFSANANAENVLLDSNWNVVKSKKSAHYYLKPPVETVDGEFKVEIYYQDNDALFCAGTLLDNKLGKTLKIEQFRGAYQCYFDDGNPYQQAFINDQGQLHGLFKKYIATGSHYVESHFENGVQQGLETGYWEGGNVRYKTTYQNDKEVGISEHFSPEGELTAKICNDANGVNQYFNLGKLNREVHKVDGLLQGIETTWGLNGQVISTQEYAKGQKQGDYFEYFDDNKVKRHYRYDNDYKVGEQLDFHENGQLARKEITEAPWNVKLSEQYNDQGEILSSTEEKHQGDRWIYQKRQYFKQGKLIRSNEEDQLKKWSLYEEFSEGELVARTESINSNRTGLYIVSSGFFEDKPLLTQEYYQNGLRHGTYERIQLNDKQRTVIERGQYTHDKPSGTWMKRQFEHGKSTFSYDDKGELHGEYRNETDSGQLLELLTFTHGKATGLCQRYANNGQLYEKGEYRDGKRHGDWILAKESAYMAYPQPNRLYWIGRYNMGAQVGLWEQVNMNNYRLKQEKYDDKGNLHGKQYTFAEDGSMEEIAEFRHGEFISVKHEFPTSSQWMDLPSPLT